MAKQVRVSLNCDLDHDEPVEEDVITVAFSYEGVDYEEEMCPEHLEEYRNWMQDYVAHARPASARRGRRSAGSTARAPRRRAEKATATAATGGNLTAIRAWARDNGRPVSDRGRISQEIRDAYAAAH